MSPTDPKPTPQSRVRFLLIVLAVVATAGLVYAMWPAAGPTAQPSNQRDARKPQATGGAQGSLEVRLEDLKQPPPGPGETTRNPFKFYVKPPPPPPKPPTPAPVHVPVVGDPDYRPPPPPPPPPITIKFFGVVEEHGTKWAVFSDGKGPPVWAREGQTVLGQYKLLKIGVESVTMSYLDGRGMQTIPLRGGL